jgi:arylsulfatase
VRRPYSEGSLEKLAIKVDRPQLSDADKAKLEAAMKAASD